MDVHTDVPGWTLSALISYTDVSKSISRVQNTLWLPSGNKYGHNTAVSGLPTNKIMHGLTSHAMRLFESNDVSRKIMSAPAHQVCFKRTCVCIISKVNTSTKSLGLAVLTNPYDTKKTPFTCHICATGFKSGHDRHMLES